MKRKSLSSAALLTVPDPRIGVSSSVDLKKCDSSRSMTSSRDPFENMKYSSRKTPSLRPILTRHRRIPSSMQISNQKLELTKPCTKSLSEAISKSKLPSIFNNPHSLQKNVKINWRAFKKASKPKDIRDVSTPYFKPHPTELVQKSRHQNKPARVHFFDHLKHKNLSEFSFGSVESNPSN